IKALAYASCKPVAAVSSLEALGLKANQKPGSLVCPLIDAKKGEIYAALFEIVSSGLREIVPQGAYKPDKLFSSLPSHRIIHFIGNGREVLKKKIFAYFKDKARFPFRSFFIAGEVGLLGLKLLKSGKGKAHQEVLPLYLRKSQAEEKNTETGISF
ncbi:MAG: tRNA threonylcarbamoyladenosine biosynthesis protein TsaB, partial [Acidobacteriota bacterium]